MLLAGDLGATNTRLGLFERHSSRPIEIVTRDFSTDAYPGLSAMIGQFLAGSPTPPEAIEAACVGVAGPVIDQRVRPTNIDWIVDAVDVMRTSGVKRLHLLNDVEAMAYAVSAFAHHEQLMLQEGTRNPVGNGVLLTAGTGLGQAMLINDGGTWRPSPSEGGHADFAARTPREIELLQYLTRTYGRAHCEHIVSGPGLVNLVRFTSEGRSKILDDSLDPDELPPRVTQAALDKTDPYCVEALDLFITIFGATAGNAAMHCVATGGVYLGGGIPPKILPAFQTTAFMDAFRAKAPMEDLMRAMPVSIILNKQAGLLGAAVFASRMS
jgi:glucokinase